MITIVTSVLAILMLLLIVVAMDMPITVLRIVILFATKTI